MYGLADDGLVGAAADGFDVTAPIAELQLDPPVVVQLVAEPGETSPVVFLTEVPNIRRAVGGVVRGGHLELVRPVVPKVHGAVPAFLRGRAGRGEHRSHRGPSQEFQLHNQSPLVALRWCGRLTQPQL